MDNKHFQIRTDKKITNGNDIRWTLTGPGWFTFTTQSIGCSMCKPHAFTGSERFFSENGVMTFLKTSTELEVWFEDDLQVTWVFEDKEGQTETCRMKTKMGGLLFKASNRHDKVSQEYRYQTGLLIRRLIYTII